MKMAVGFRYSSGYRCYALARIGFACGYLWYVFDFLRIHLAIWDQLHLLMQRPSDVIFSTHPGIDTCMRSLAIFLNGKAIVWTFAFASPLVAGLYLWGRYRWLQAMVGLWMAGSIVALTSMIGVFNTTADLWLNYTFALYCLTALVSTTKEWEANEPGLSLARWKTNPAISSTYAWFLVLLQFTVYFFAGINKLVDGWKPWTSGVALQNLASDSSMHEFIRGAHVPFWLSWILCYVTLFQRLIVPFGFHLKRFRIWSVIILISMHIGYAMLMYVNLFPLVGIFALLLIWPPPSSSSHQPVSSVQRQPARRTAHVIRLSTLALVSVWLLAEPARLTVHNPMPVENKMMLGPAWRMFADGGVYAGGKWRIILSTPQGNIDATSLPCQTLPHLWRDRFYQDLIFHDLLNQNTGPGTFVDRLLQATEKLYRERQIQANADPSILNASFELYRWQPPPKS